MLRKAKLPLVAVVAVLVGFAVGWFAQLHQQVPEQAIKIITVNVRSIGTSDVGGGTKLRILTRYTNTGCEQVLLTRFLINSLTDQPAISLPRQHGIAILPIDKDEVDEYVILDMKLTGGRWHLFSVASCYRHDDPIPASDVAPIALFDVN